MKNVNFSVEVDEYSDSEAIMPTAEIMHLIRKKMNDILHFLREISQGLVWKIASEEYFHGEQNNLVSAYSRWYAAKEKNICRFRGKVCKVILLTFVNSSLPGAM